MNEFGQPVFEPITQDLGVLHRTIVWTQASCGLTCSDAIMLRLHLQVLYLLCQVSNYSATSIIRTSFIWTLDYLD